MKHLVVTDYMFRTGSVECAVHAFSSEEAAKEFLKKDFENECRIAIEENGWDIDTRLSPDGEFAEVIDIFGHDDGGQLDYDITRWMYIAPHDVVEEDKPFQKEAAQLTKSIEVMASKPANLENFESYLSQHFEAWLGRANTPEKMVAEMWEFAEM